MHIYTSRKQQNLHDVSLLSSIIMHSMLYYSSGSDSSQNIAHGLMKCFPSQHVTVSSFCQFIVQDVLIEKNER